MSTTTTMDASASSSSGGGSPRAFVSPIPRPKFYTSPPLSTKREKMTHTPMQRKSAPRPKTAPNMYRPYARKFFQQKPQLISFKGLPQNHILTTSTIYDPSITETYFEQCFQTIKKLGEGSFGEVFEVRSREDGKLYAVKRTFESFRNNSDRELKLREVQKHELLPPHLNLVHFVKSWEECGHLYIQMELCDRSLSDYANQVHPVPEHDVWNFFIDLLLAVDHLHAHDLIHCDIKTENIFLSKDNICKLGDFGLIFDSKNDKPDLAEEGDSRYLAEEVLNSYPTKASDIFSLGAIILELATDLDLPSRGDGWHQIRNGAIPNKFFEKMSTDLRRLIVNMLSHDPLARPTSFQLLVDPAVSSRLSARKRAHKWHNIKCAAREIVVDDVYAWLVALFHLIMVPFIWFYNKLHNTKSRIYMKTRSGKDHAANISRQPSSEWELNGEMHASEIPFFSAEHSRRSAAAGRFSLDVTPPHRKAPPSRLCFEDTESSDDDDVNTELTTGGFRGHLLAANNNHCLASPNAGAGGDEPGGMRRVTPPPEERRMLPPFAVFETPRHSPALPNGGLRSRLVTPMGHGAQSGDALGTPVGLGSAYRNVTLRPRVLTPQRPLFGSSARCLAAGDFKKE